MLFRYSGPEEIRLLDIILEELQNEYPVNTNIGLLRDKVLIKLFGKDATRRDDDISINNYMLFVDVFDSALRYLDKELLIEHRTLKGNDNRTKITYNGIVKIAKGGFVGEYKSNRRDKYLQRMFWIAAGLSLCFSIYSIWIRQ